MAYFLPVSQAPHASHLNGGEGPTAREYYLRPSQRVTNGPRIDAAIAGMAPGELRPVYLDVSGDIFRVRRQSDGNTYNTLDWTPFGVWHEPTRQGILGGFRGMAKFTAYADVEGDLRELPMPAAVGRGEVETGHYYGYITRNPANEVFVAKGVSRPYRLDPATEEWTALPAPPLTNGSNGGSFIWLEDRSRLAAYAGSAQRWMTIRPDIDVAWTIDAAGLGHGMHALAVYHPLHARTLMVGGTDTIRRASLVTSFGVATQVLDVPADIKMSAGSWCRAHPSGCWLLKTMDEPSPGVYATRLYTVWPNAALNAVSYQDLGVAPDDALDNSTLLPGYNADTDLIIAVSGVYAWRHPAVAPTADVPGIGVPVAAQAPTATGGASAQLPGAAAGVAAGVIAAEAGGSAVALVPGAGVGVAAGAPIASAGASAALAGAAVGVQAGTILADAGGSATALLPGAGAGVAAGAPQALGGASAALPGVRVGVAAGVIGEPSQPPAWLWITTELPAPVVLQRELPPPQVLTTLLQ